ncbi:MAG: MBL fold metallo-hydrolase [Bacteroidales bacterium]|nr:MBL fold metallo-hydrolase [Bacteroidales bacterium]
MNLYPILTGNLKLDGGAMFGVVPKVIWNKLYPADENNLCNWSMRCLLIVDGERKILIDSGVGDKQDEKFFGHYFLNGDDTLENSLSELGYSPDDITDHILTHLHFDHVGGSVRKNQDGEYEPTFRNATHWISKAQWEWATKPNRREKASFLTENIIPIMEKGKLKLIEKEGEILPNVFAKIYNGHTDGQIVPHINFKGKTVCFMGDLLPSTAHIPMPYVMSYDTRPLLTLEDKKSFFADAIKHDYILFFEHDLYHECCNLQETPKGIREKDTFTLAEYFA